MKLRRHISCSEVLPKKSELWVHFGSRARGTFQGPPETELWKRKRFEFITGQRNIPCRARQANANRSGANACATLQKIYWRDGKLRKGSHLDGLAHQAPSGKDGMGIPSRDPWLEAHVLMIRQAASMAPRMWVETPHPDGGLKTGLKCSSRAILFMTWADGVSSHITGSTEKNSRRGRQP